MASKLIHIRLSDTIPSSELNKFHCRDGMLNQFLRRKARKHLSEMLAITYLVYDLQHNLVGYYTLSSDTMPATDIIQSRFQNGKLYHAYPAIKIGRFAIDEKYKGVDLGTDIMDYIKLRFSTEPQNVASRFLLVDAYNIDKVIEFYKDKNGFEFWTKKDRYDDTRVLYYDLKS